LDGYSAVAGRIAALRCHLAGPLKLYQDKTYKEHKDMVAAVASRDGNRLRALITYHIEMMRENYIRAIDEGLIQVPQARARSKGPKGTSARKAAVLQDALPL
jgi:hypothetical protein